MKKVGIYKGQREVLLNDHVKEGFMEDDFGSLSSCALIEKVDGDGSAVSGVRLSLEFLLVVETLGWLGRSASSGSRSQCC